MGFYKITTVRMCGAFALIGIISTLGLTAGPAEAHSISSRTSTQAKLLAAQMANFAAVTRGPVGAAVEVVEGGGRAIALHGEQHFPMQSTYKLPIAMALLHEVDLGKVSLNQQVHIAKADLPLLPHYSAIRDDYPNGGTFTVSKLLDEMIGNSDGTACDILLKFAGGPQKVTTYLRTLGIQDMVVATTEKTMWQNEQVQQYRNWATPDAMLSLLVTFQKGHGLSVSSRRLLLKLMVGSQTGPHRIKGLLPAGTIVAHKTGSSGTVSGVTRATNDVGLITLPDGRHLAVVVFVSDTRVDETTQEAVIAQIARAAWDNRIMLEGDN